MKKPETRLEFLEHLLRAALETSRNRPVPRRGQLSSIEKPEGAEAKRQAEMFKIFIPSMQIQEPMDNPVVHAIETISKPMHSPFSGFTHLHLEVLTEKAWEYFERMSKLRMM